MSLVEGQGASQVACVPEDTPSLLVDTRCPVGGHIYAEDTWRSADGTGERGGREKGDVSGSPQVPVADCVAPVAAEEAAAGAEADLSGGQGLEAERGDRVVSGQVDYVDPATRGAHCH